MLTHAHCLRAGLDSVHCLWLDEGERCLTALPMFHVNAQAMSLLGTLTVGGTLIMLEEFRATKFWTQVRAHGATQTCLVAMQLRTILAQPPAPGERDHEVRRLFFAINVTDQEKQEFEARFGVDLINGYGLSEAMTLLTCRAGRRPAALAVDRPALARPPPAARRRPRRRGRAGRGRRDRGRGRPRAATCCSATTATTTPTAGRAAGEPPPHRRQRLRGRARATSTSSTARRT